MNKSLQNFVGPQQKQLSPKVPSQPCCQLPKSVLRPSRECQARDLVSSQRCETRINAVPSTSGRFAVAASVEVQEKPTSAETARTIVDVMSHGTLCTLNKDGTPLGTYTSYVLEAGGQPLLRLRTDAVHKANLEREPRCSLFVQPQDCPARMLARVTLIGKAELVDEATASQASELHRSAASGLLGVDAPRETDQFYRLSIEECFYVGGMGTNSQAEVISSDEFRAAEPDILKTAAPELVRFFNRDRTEDVMRIAAYASGSKVEQVYSAELLWVDRIGAYLAAERYGSERQIYRVRFQRPVVDERDARSVLTMLAQFAWEEERHYSPPIPEAIAS